MPAIPVLELLSNIGFNKVNQFPLKSSLLFFITILIILSGCRPNSNFIAELKNGPVPEALIFKQSIEGIILGKKLSEPFGVTSDMAGNIYLVDAGNNRLIWFDRELVPLRDAAGYGTDEGLLNTPSYISIDNNLNLYVSDGGNQRISVFDTRLNYAKQIELIDPADPIKFGRPAGVKINQYGELWVADQDKSKIWIFDNIGSFDRTIGGIESTGGVMLNPAAVTADAHGRTLVCDKGNHLIKIYDSFGIFLFEFGESRMEKPTGISVDNSGNIWVLDAKGPGLFCFDSGGELIFSPEQMVFAGNHTPKNLVDLTVTPDNRLIISDFGNDRLLVFQILYP